MGDFGKQLLAASLEGIRDVFEEDEAQDDVLVFGRIKVPAELVGGSPQRLLESEIGAVAVAFGRPAFRHASESTGRDYGEATRSARISSVVLRVPATG